MPEQSARALNPGHARALNPGHDLGPSLQDPNLDRGWTQVACRCGGGAAGKSTVAPAGSAERARSPQGRPCGSGCIAQRDRLLTPEDNGWIVLLQVFVDSEPVTRAAAGIGPDADQAGIGPDADQAGIGPDAEQAAAGDRNSRLAHSLTARSPAARNALHAISSSASSWMY